MGRNVDPESTESRLVGTENGGRNVSTPGPVGTGRQDRITVTCVDTSVITCPLSQARGRRRGVMGKRWRKEEKERGVEV